MEENAKFELTNVQSEILLCACFWKSPDNYLMYGSAINSQVDFSDAATRYYYDLFVDYYLTFSQTVAENKVNNFASQNIERFKLYRQFGGYKTIKEFMNMADNDDVKTYYNTCKKYALLREFDSAGYPVDKILSYKSFQQLNANDIYRIVRSKVDKISNKVQAIDEAILLNKDAGKYIDEYLKSPQMGDLTPWPSFNYLFKGLLPGLFINSFPVNNGKSRFMVALCAYETLIMGKKYMMISNEMTEEQIRDCLLTLCISNKEYQDKHGIYMYKPEREITLGLYRDDATGEFMERKTNKNGEFTETQEEFVNRVYQNSTEYRNVKKVAEWMDSELEGKFWFYDISRCYDTEEVILQMKKAKIVYGCTGVCYDVLKSYGIEEWSQLKLDATRISECASELGIVAFCSAQTTDASQNISVLDFSTNNVGASKGMAQVAQCMTMGRRLKKEEYHEYSMVTYNDDWGEECESDLDVNKDYFATLCIKNRYGQRGRCILFEVDLDIDRWTEVGYLIRKST